MDEKNESKPSKRDNLQDLREIEGFPIGEDEDIHNLSEPPYYTAYPNPHIQEFIKKFGKSYDQSTDNYSCEPYAENVRVGKHDPVYGAHTYHTKVPYQAIMKFIKHYTRPGDVVLDGFCGSGMTGVAAQLLGRNAILIDLCPIASFIASNCNLVEGWSDFQVNLNYILNEAKKQLGWVYETLNESGKKGVINYVVWSDLFKCTYCGNEIVLGKLDPNKKPGEKVENPRCPFCNADLSGKLPHAWLTSGNTKTLKQEPILISFSFNKKRFQKIPDEFDKELLNEIDSTKIDEWFPSYRMPKGRESRRNDKFGVLTTDQFFTKRNLLVLSKLRKLCFQKDKRVWFVVSSVIQKVSKLMALRGDYIGRITSGTLYIAPIRQEVNVFYSTGIQLRKFPKFIQVIKKATGHTIISTQSATDLSNIPNSSVDYIFTDPPFGGNLMYSELNFMWESWLKVFTNNKDEAIINSTQDKDITKYKDLMGRAFSEYYRVLKPGRWLTIVFHNSKAVVWNVIQNSIAKAGFIVAQVAILDKKSKSFKQATSVGAVHKDLVINAYKPKESFTKVFMEKTGSNLERNFIEQHLERLPIEPNIERTEQMLYSKMLAYYIQHGYEIVMNAKQFYLMLLDYFEERDGYWFLYGQVDSYEAQKKKVSLDKIQATLFISDEKSAIQWLYLFLSKPRSYAEIYPEFVKNILASEEYMPELKDLLEENFVSENEKYRRPMIREKEQIDERREKRLLREFENYLEKAINGKKIEAPRKEALLVGFTSCYREKKFNEILTLAKKLPVQIIEGSTEIFDLVDIAKTKISQ
ncbi:MAG: DNA methylase [Candidatus Bathyarchaeota archaeon]|nr:MAG: DNA methylase [Candidatus Bathyarchaeota archaeon]